MKPDIVEAAVDLGTKLRNDCNWVGTDGRRIIVYVENIDALYNKGAVYFESGDKENACKVWKEISEIGQVNGKELYLNNCN
jgi:hypothetical protein